MVATASLYTLLWIASKRSKLYHSVQFVKDMCLVKTMNEQAACNKLFVVVVVVVN